MTWLLPKRIPHQPDPQRVRTHRMMDDDAHGQVRSLCIFYKGQQFRSAKALQAKFRISRRDIERLIFEGKAIRL